MNGLTNVVWPRVEGLRRSLSKQDPACVNSKIGCVGWLCLLRLRVSVGAWTLWGLRSSCFNKCSHLLFSISSLLCCLSPLMTPLNRPLHFWHKCLSFQVNSIFLGWSLDGWGGKSLLLLNRLAQITWVTVYIGCCEFLSSHALLRSPGKMPALEKYQNLFSLWLVQGTECC